MTKRGIHDLATAGFGRAANDYERGRPGYPPEAVAWLVEKLAIDSSATVLDLAAGTGKLTRELVPTGATIVAVEPVEGMRRKLEEALPGVRALDGTAEAIPLPAASVDAVAVAQAFHWFRGDEALAEIHRVLRPGGRLALVWNRRDTTHPIQAAFTETIDRYRGDAPAHRSEDWREAFARTTLFACVEEYEARWEEELDAERLVERAASISFLAALPDESRRTALAEVERLARRLPDRFPFAYVAQLHVFERR